MFPLIRTYWHQSPPYNNKLPINIFSKNCDNCKVPAGCATVGIVQLVNFHKIYNSRNYNWNALSGDLGKDIFEEHVASFFKDIVVDFKASYFKNTTAVSVRNIIKGLNRIGYMAHIGDFSYTKVKSFLDNGNPIFMMGRRQDNAIHFWIVDGYKHGIKKFLHMNWGLGKGRGQGKNHNYGWNSIDELGKFSKKYNYNSNFKVLYVKPR